MTGWQDDRKFRRQLTIWYISFFTFWLRPKTPVWKTHWLIHPILFLSKQMVASKSMRWWEVAWLRVTVCSWRPERHTADQCPHSAYCTLVTSHQAPPDCCELSNVVYSRSKQIPSFLMFIILTVHRCFPNITTVMFESFVMTHRKVEGSFDTNRPFYLNFRIRRQ